VSTPVPGYDEIVLSAPEAGQLCNTLGCKEAGRQAAVVVTYGVLNDPGAGYHDRQALWRECWGQSYPECRQCWDTACQVALKYRPGLVVTNVVWRETSQTSGGRA
jgi:hypothetical protein